MDEQLIALYHRHIATAFDRNLRLAEFVALKAEKVKWKYEVATAELVCGPKLKFEAPLLGTHARANDSWLWAWSNRNLKLTLTNRALGDLVRVTAHRLGLSMFAHPGFSLEPLLGPELTKYAAVVLGAVLSRELEFDTYHIEKEKGYDSTILMRDDRLKTAERYALHRVLTVFPKVVKALPVFDHRAALTHFAQDYGLTANTLSGALTISDGKGTLTATFDDRDRLTKLNGTDVAEPPAKKPPAAPKPAVKKVAAKAKKPAPKAKPVAKKAAVKAKAKPAPKVAKKAPAKKR